ncbi:MAG: peptide chain release factor 1 [Solirubrobacteraceae bacterium]
MSDKLVDKLQALKQKHDEIADLIIQPNVIADQKKYVELSKQYKELEEIVDIFKVYSAKLNVIKEANEIIEKEIDAEMIELAKVEKDEAINTIPQIEEKIKFLLIPKDPEEDKNAIMEIRSGTGGDEACIFVEDMFRMYSMYFKEKKWTFDVVNASEGGVKGYKEVVLNISGSGVYGNLKFESGVHRVQRVPETESQGRVHTSAITIAIMPEAEEVDVIINPADIRRDTFRSSGAGGQHVNKTESAVRLTHAPSGVVVECQEERSQHKNMEKAMKYLRAKIYQIEVEKKEKERSEHRKTLVSTGDRSAKIRTYNYPQGRVTDHRINKSIYNLDVFLNGEIQEMIDSLKLAENAEKLKGEEF